MTDTKIKKSASGIYFVRTIESGASKKYQPVYQAGENKSKLEMSGSFRSFKKAVQFIENTIN